MTIDNHPQTDAVDPPYRITFVLNAIAVIAQAPLVLRHIVTDSYFHNESTKDCGHRHQLRGSIKHNDMDPMDGDKGCTGSATWIGVFVVAGFRAEQISSIGSTSNSTKVTSTFFLWCDARGQARRCIGFA